MEAAHAQRAQIAAEATRQALAERQTAKEAEQLMLLTQQRADRKAAAEAASRQALAAQQAEEAAIQRQIEEQLRRQFAAEQERAALRRQEAAESLARKEAADLVEKQKDQDRIAAIAKKRLDEIEQARYACAIADTKCLRRQPAGLPATGTAHGFPHPLVDTPPLGIFPPLMAQAAPPTQQMPAANGNMHGRPAGSSNDPVLALGPPYVNPPIDPSPLLAVSFPIYNPMTGARPEVRTISENQDISEFEAAAMQTCTECDGDSATRRCPK